MVVSVTDSGIDDRMNESRKTRTDTRALTRRALIGGSAAAWLAAMSRPARAQLRRISIGSNPAGTNFHLVAGGMARLFQEQLDIPSIVRPYSGSSVYLPMLERGEIALGINSSVDSYLAYRGLDPFPADIPGPHPPLPRDCPGQTQPGIGFIASQ